LFHGSAFVKWAEKTSSCVYVGRLVLAPVKQRQNWPIAANKKDAGHAWKLRAYIKTPLVKSV
jgi:hypothetical protein